MPSKKNPLNLNALQLKTLTLLQELARLPGHSRPGEEPDSAVITSLPYPHGDHFHLGDALVASRDATGLHNPAVWAALERKGLIRSLPDCAMLTPLGVGRPVADCAKLFGMNAAGYQHAVETGAGRAGDVGAQAVADGKNAGAVFDADQLQACVVDRTER